MTIVTRILTGLAAGLILLMLTAVYQASAASPAQARADLAAEAGR